MREIEKCEKKGYKVVLRAGILVLGACFVLGCGRKEETQEDLGLGVTDVRTAEGNEENPSEEVPAVWSGSDEVSEAQSGQPGPASESETEPGNSGEQASESETEPEKSGEELLEERAQAVLRELTLEEKVLQLFMVTPEALNGMAAGKVTAAGDTTKNSIGTYPVGGLVYFAGNLQNPEQVKEMLSNTCRYYEEAGMPQPFLGVDEEGGKVARIGGNPAFGVEKIGSMSAVSDEREAKRIGTVIGTYLAELGFSVDFAPVADVLTNPQNTVIGDRSFGSDAEQVAELAMAEVQGLEDAGVHAVLKHYPGHGATQGDTHEGYAYTDKALEELMEAELVPFEAGIQEGVLFLMAAHISVPSITGDSTPCSLSRYMITDVLRERLGYDGIVVTDAMNMGAVSQQYDSAQAAVLALQAGVDLILMPQNFPDAYEGVLQAVKSGELTEARIDESVMRILRVKCLSEPEEIQ